VDAWPTYLDDDRLAQLRSPAIDPRTLEIRYDPTCPSEWYRGYATGLIAARAELQQATTVGNAARLVDTLDQSIQAPDDPAGPVSQPLAGYKFALMNAYLYATSASSVQQILHTMDLELPCIAYGFFANRQRGL
jgi:hypothetical protein